MPTKLPIGDWIEFVVNFLLDNFQGTFDAIAAVVEAIAGSIETALLVIPAWLIIAVFCLLALWRLGLGFTVFVLASLVLILSMDLWKPTMETLALVFASTLLSLALGLPLGIWMAKSARAAGVMKTTLDFMQTMPAFVYLIPAVMFFGLGKVPGTFATVIFAMPPAVRLTALGIRQVPVEIVEAGRAYGATGSQLLFRVELPNALPSIMAGVNQTMMLALSMVVIASMIGAGGLGNVVLSGIQRLDVGLGFTGGISVVILAIILDRLTQSFGARRRARSPLFALIGRLRPAGAEDRLHPRADEAAPSTRTPIGRY
jgi:glycine betaine/proline transport system permease protein